MKELYSQWLRVQCESWMKENLPELFLLSYKRIQKLVTNSSDEIGVAKEECLLSQIDLSIGPWQGVYFHFKEPGEMIFPLEKCNLSQLREQGNLVLIIRCLEDFKMLMHTYFSAYVTHSITYTIKSA